MRRLDAEISRCVNDTCPLRHKCLRFLTMKVDGNGIYSYTMFRPVSVTESFDEEGGAVRLTCDHIISAEERA